MLTPKENYLETVRWGNPEYVPCTYEAYAIVGVPTIPVFEHPWFEDGTDPFGTNWIVDGMGATPDTRKAPLLDDVCDWEKVVRIPDVSRIDIKPIAEGELKDIDRSQKVLGYFHPCGVFERLEALMGVTEACVALVEEPDACRDFFEAITDYRIEAAKKVIDAYHPDVYITFDDVCTANAPFMSPETYREVIKPSHKRFISFIASQGIVAGQHCCGMAEPLLDDFVDNGTQLWHSAQIMNDLDAIQERYRGRLAIEGFWNTQGKPGLFEATEEEVRMEVRTITERYGKRGGAIILPILTNPRGQSLNVGDDRIPFVMDEWAKCCRY